jgi:hypothetical protein
VSIPDSRIHGAIRLQIAILSSTILSFPRRILNQQADTSQTPPCANHTTGILIMDKIEDTEHLLAAWNTIPAKCVGYPLAILQ